MVGSQKSLRSKLEQGIEAVKDGYTRVSRLDTDYFPQMRQVKAKTSKEVLQELETVRDAFQELSSLWIKNASDEPYRRVPSYAHFAPAEPLKQRVENTSSLCRGGFDKSQLNDGLEADVVREAKKGFVSLAAENHHEPNGHDSGISVESLYGGNEVLESLGAAISEEYQAAAKPLLVSDPHPSVSILRPTHRHGEQRRAVQHYLFKELRKDSLAPFSFPYDAVKKAVKR